MTPQDSTETKTSLKQPSFWRSMGHAWDGLLYTVLTQRNARIHLIAGTLVLAFAGWLGLSRVEISILVLTIGAVIAAETINTAVEAIIDLLSPEWHERAKVGKDVAAGGVLIVSITAVGIGLLILGPPLWQMLGVYSGAD